MADEAVITEPTATEESILGTPPADAIEKQQDEQVVSPPVAEKVLEEAKAEPPKEPEGAPEKYEFAFPEGFKAETKSLERFEATARELNLTNEAAQKLVGIYADMATEPGRAFAETIKGYRAEITKDPNYESTLSMARKARDVGDEDFKTLMGQPGWGDRPEIVRFLAKIGTIMAEDQFIEGRMAGGREKSMSEILFPTHTKKQ